MSKQTGEGVKVAIIDSGINMTHKIFKNTRVKGCSLKLNSKEEIIISKNFDDNIGHGTATAGIIVRKAPNVELFIIKIFQEKLKCNHRILVKAIEVAINKDVDIINLSLGTTEEKNLKEIKRIINIAEENKINIISSESNTGHVSYPASLKNTIRVGGGDVRGKFNFYYQRDSLGDRFICRGDRQKLCWTVPEYIFLDGTSFAAPHMSACVSLLLDYGIKTEDIKKTLIFLSNKNIKELKYTNSLMYRVLKKENIKWIKQATVFPFNKEMHSLLNFKELLDFKIKNVCDIKGKGTKGKDTGMIIRGKENGLLIQTKFKEAIKDSDTVILGHLEKISNIYNEDILFKYLKISIESGKNVFSFSSLTNKKYSKLLELAKKNNQIIKYPLINEDNWKEYEDYYRYIKNEKIKVPILGIFGTSSNQGKFTTQLAIRNKLQEYNYKVGQIGTEPHSELFGIDETFPLGFQGDIKIPIDNYISYLDYIIKKVALKKPDIIIAGSQSGIIPYGIYTIPRDNYTLPSIAFLMGINADAYILTVNPSDSLKYIEESLKALEFIGKGKVIAISMGRISKKKVGFNTSELIINEKISADDYFIKKNKIENKFNIPVFDTYYNNDVYNLVEHIIHSLSYSQGLKEVSKSE
ncbi:S8 family serine peptidase [Senegalia massiliensis]|uniref:S8 family serine peptidase n=1 Tax=Senegalia massiliensis TaxID=1720316 RepID=UPI0013626E54|nr:S8 family serine peptidase [Senegalia massiliensis]